MKSFAAAAALTLATLASQAQAQTGCAVSCFQKVITEHPPLSCTEANMYLCFCKDTSLQNYFIDCAKSSCGNNYQTAVEFGYSLCNDLGAPINTAQPTSSAAAQPTTSAAAQPSSSAAAQPSSSAAAQSSSAAAASSSAAQSSAAQSSAAASSSKASSAQASATGASSSAVAATSAATTPGAPAPTTVRTTTVAQPTGGNSTTTVVPVNGAGALAGSGFAVVAGVAMAALQL
ncbi:unnamed protein product [Clonostachys rosea f. rosea IK726]|uniref:Uncharacterized protein n=1 Tax=Clonostachys rosea f. rosea IK726 TaxID=1349383 RepID=A0ACA9UL86_BIOOC|nr:unnamed protein product [Clonostachys rosea f. rosea IK726]